MPVRNLKSQLLSGEKDYKMALFDGTTTNNAQTSIPAGTVRGILSVESVNDTVWHTVTSADFFDPVTGSNCAPGLDFAFLGIQNPGSQALYLKYRTSNPGDATTNEIPVGTLWSDDLDTLNATITSISYKKATATDAVLLFAGFNR